MQQNGRTVAGGGRRALHGVLRKLDRDQALEPVVYRWHVPELGVGDPDQLTAEHVSALQLQQGLSIGTIAAVRPHSRRELRHHELGLEVPRGLLHLLFGALPHEYVADVKPVLVRTHHNPR